MGPLDAAISEVAWKLAEQREAGARFLARSHLPRRLEWLVDRPRLLGLAYKLRSKWRPTVYVGSDLDVTVVAGRTPDGTMVVVSQDFGFSPPR